MLKSKQLITILRINWQFASLNWSGFMNFDFLRKYGLFLFLPAIALLSLILLKHGLSLTFDSYNFLCGADTFNKTSRLLMCDRSAMVLSPPGFSLFLSLFIASPNSLHDIYLLVTIILYSLTLVCWYFIFCQEIKEDLVLLFATLQLATALPLFYVHLFVWSEGLFLFLTSFGILSFFRFKEHDKICWVVLCAISFSISITVKYVGLLMFVSLVLGDIITVKKTFKRSQYIALCFPLLVFGYLMLRNYSIAGTFTGIRPFLNRDAAEIFQSCAGVILHWVMPSNIFPTVFSVLFVVVLGLGCWFMLKRNQVWAILFFSFFLFLYVSAWRTDIEYDERLFVPVFPVFIMFVMGLLEGLPRITSLYYLRNFFLVYWTVYSIFRLGKNVIQWIY